MQNETQPRPRRSKFVEGFHPEQEQPRKVTKRRRPLILAAYLLFWVVMLVMFSGLIISQAGRYNELRADLEHINSQIATARAEAEYLYLQAILFDSDAYIEQLARERLGLVRPNEIIFRNIAD